MATAYHIDANTGEFRRLPNGEVLNDKNAYSDIPSERVEYFARRRQEFIHPTGEEIQEEFNNLLTYFLPDAEFFIVNPYPKGLTAPEHLDKLEREMGLMLVAAKHDRFVYVKKDDSGKVEETVNKLMSAFSSNSAWAPYGTLLITALPSPPVEKTLNILVVDWETGEGGKILDKEGTVVAEIPAEVIQKFVGEGDGTIDINLDPEQRRQFQVRGIINIRADGQDKLQTLKGTFVPRDLNKLLADYLPDGVRIDAVVSSDQLKGNPANENKKISAAMPPGWYPETPITMGVSEVANLRLASLGIQWVNAIGEAVLQDAKPIIEERLRELREIASDPRKVARDFIRCHELRASLRDGGEEEVEEQVDGEVWDDFLDDDGNEIDAATFVRLLQADLESEHGQLLEHPWVIQKLRDHLQKQYMECVTGRFLKGESAMLCSCRELGKDEIHIPGMRDGEEVIVHRSPIDHGNSIFVLTNRALKDPMSVVPFGSIALHPDTAKALNMDADGDCPVWVNAREWPNVAKALAVLREAANCYKTPEFIEKAQYEDLSRAEIALKIMENNIGYVANLTMKAIALERECSYVPDSEREKLLREQTYLVVNKKEALLYGLPDQCSLLNDGRLRELANLHKRFESPDYASKPLTSLELNIYLDKAASAYHDLVGILADQLYIEVQSAKSSNRADSPTLKVCSALTERSVHVLDLRKDRTVYGTRPMPVNDHTVLGQVANLVNSSYEASSLSPRPVSQFHDLFGGIEPTAEQEKLAKSLIKEYNSLQAGAHAIRAEVEEQNNRPYLKIIATSSTTGKQLEVILSPDKCNHPQLLGTSPPSQLLKPQVYIEDYSGKWALSAAELDERGEIIYKKNEDGSIKTNNNGSPVPQRRRVGYVTSASVKEHPGIFKIDKKFVEISSVDIEIRPGYTRHHVKAAWAMLRAYADAARDRILNPELPSVSAATWQHQSRGYTSGKTAKENMDKELSAKMAASFGIFLPEIEARLPELQFKQLTVINLAEGDYAGSELPDLRGRMSVELRPHWSNPNLSSRWVKIDGRTLGRIQDSSAQFPVGATADVTVQAAKSQQLTLTSPQFNFSVVVSRVPDNLRNKLLDTTQDFSISFSPQVKEPTKFTPYLMLGGEKVGQLKPDEVEAARKALGVNKIDNIPITLAVSKPPPAFVSLTIDPTTVVYPVEWTRDNLNAGQLEKLNSEVVRQLHPSLYAKYREGANNFGQYPTEEFTDIPLATRFFELFGGANSDGDRAARLEEIRATDPTRPELDPRFLPVIQEIGKHYDPILEKMTRELTDRFGAKCFIRHIHTERRSDYYFCVDLTDASSRKALREALHFPLKISEPDSEGRRLQAVAIPIEELQEIFAEVGKPPVAEEPTPHILFLIERLFLTTPTQEEALAWHDVAQNLTPREWGWIVQQCSDKPLIPETREGSEWNQFLNEVFSETNSSQLWDSTFSALGPDAYLWKSARELQRQAAKTGDDAIRLRIAEILSRLPKDDAWQQSVLEVKVDFHDYLVAQRIEQDFANNLNKLTAVRSDGKLVAQPTACATKDYTITRQIETPTSSVEIVIVPNDSKDSPVFQATLVDGQWQVDNKLPEDVYPKMVAYLTDNQKLKNLQSIVTLTDTATKQLVEHLDKVLTDSNNLSQATQMKGSHYDLTRYSFPSRTRPGQASRVVTIESDTKEVRFEAGWVDGDWQISNSIPVKDLGAIADMLSVEDGRAKVARKVTLLVEPLVTSEPQTNLLDGVRPLPGTEKHFEKDARMGAIATQFIGKEANPDAERSSTRNYRLACECCGVANTGDYKNSDIIMVSGSLPSTQPERNVTALAVEQVFEKHYVPLLDKAIAVKSQFVVGNAGGTDKLVRQYLAERGYKLEEHPDGYARCLPQIINIWSGSNDPLAAALTNPTELAKRKGNLKQSYPVKFRGKTYDDAEVAYQKNKVLVPDEKKGDLMTEIIAAKLEQHPQLVAAVEKRGGRAWLASCEHIVNGGFWEGKGEESPFIRSLVAAYDMALNQIKQEENEGDIKLDAPTPKILRFVEVSESAQTNVWLKSLSALSQAELGWMCDRVNVALNPNPPLTVPDNTSGEDWDKFVDAITVEGFECLQESTKHILGPDATRVKNVLDLEVFVIDLGGKVDPADRNSYDKLDSLAEHVDRLKDGLKAEYGEALFESLADKVDNIEMDMAMAGTPLSVNLLKEVGYFEGIEDRLLTNWALGAQATKFIGKETGADISTYNYRLACECCGVANTDDYLDSDIVMVAGSDVSSGCSHADIKQTFEEHYVPLLDKAVSARCKFLVGDDEGTDRLVQKYLEERGYKLEQRSDGEVQWLPQKQVAAEEVRPFCFPSIIISPESSPLAAALTNSTSLSLKNNKILKSYPVEFNGQKHLDAEVAYISSRDTVPATDEARAGLMTEILTAKLIQHPNLVRVIEEMGGKAFLENCEYVGRPEETAWQGKGRESRFINCLVAAYDAAIARVGSREILGDDGKPLKISGDPVPMNFPLKMMGEHNPLPVSTTIDAMRGYGRTHTTREYNLYQQYKLKEGDIAIALGGKGEKVAFRVGKQYEITPAMAADPSFRKKWAATEKHSIKLLDQMIHKAAAKGLKVWGVEMEPIGNYLVDPNGNAKIFKFPDTKPLIPQPTKQTPDRSVPNGTNPPPPTNAAVGKMMETIWQCMSLQKVLDKPNPDVIVGGKYTYSRQIHPGTSPTDTKYIITVNPNTADGSSTGSSTNSSPLFKAECLKGKWQYSNSLPPEHIPQISHSLVSYASKLERELQERQNKRGAMDLE